MSKDELRNCMALEKKIKDKANSVDSAKLSLDAQKQEIAAVRQSLTQLRTSVERHRELLLQADAAVRDHGTKVDEWSAELKEAEESKMASAERRRRELEKERSKLIAVNKELTAKRTDQLAQYEAAVSKYNIQGKSLDETISVWNQSNEKLAEDANQVGDLREEYSADCAHRRFLEEDEAAIKQGK